MSAFHSAAEIMEGWWDRERRKKNDGNGGRIELTNNYIVSEDAGSTFLVHMGLENVN